MLITDSFVFVANPRTASRSTEQLLSEVLGGDCEITKTHHPKTNHPALVSGLPVYGVVRYPLDQLVSWLHHCGKIDMREFIRKPPNNWLIKDRLTIYAAYMTHAIPLDIGVTEIVNIITGTDKATLHEEPRIGVTGSNRSIWKTSDLVSIAQNRYLQDFELYWEALKNYTRVNE